MYDLYWYADEGLKPLIGHVQWHTYRSVAVTRLHIAFVCGKSMWRNERLAELRAPIQSAGRYVGEDVCVNVDSGAIVRATISLSIDDYPDYKFRASLKAVWPSAVETYRTFGKR